MARDSFTNFAPLSVVSNARTKIIFDFFDLLSATAAHANANRPGGHKVSRLAGWWAFKPDSADGFEHGYKNWLAAADATSHLFFAYLRVLMLNSRTSFNGISAISQSLWRLLRETEYLPERSLLLTGFVRHVVTVVDTVAATLSALLCRANSFQYREDDLGIRKLSEYKDPVRALTEECRRVLELIAVANFTSANARQISEAHPVPRQPDENKRPRTPTWAEFMSRGYSGNSSSKDLSHPRSEKPLQYFLPVQQYRRHESTDQSWAAFEDIGLASNSSDITSFQITDSDLPPEPGEFAKITTFNLDAAFWWLWLSSLAPEETPDRKAAFGRSVLVETMIPAHQWIVFEEMVKSVAPVGRSSDLKKPSMKFQDSKKIQVSKEKKGFWGWWKKGKGGSEP